ncbi:MAG: hypothetical protein WC071_09810 [Victivallaceae bacterium]
MSIYLSCFKTMRRSLAVVCLAWFAMFFSGCDDLQNNSLTTKDMVDHFVKNGIKVEQIQPVRPDVLKATEAVAVKISGTEIGIYKYNIDVKKQQEKVERITDEGFVYVLGLKYPVLVKGTFVLIGVDTNPQKDKIIAALKTFK